MRRAIKTALGLALAVGAVLLLDDRARSRARRLLGRRRRTADRTLELTVKSELHALTADPREISVEAAHGCVMLTGPVPTEERAQLVQGVAKLPGVDSVVDLLTERSD